jgi:hypothetical protein
MNYPVLMLSFRCHSMYMFILFRHSGVASSGLCWRLFVGICCLLNSTLNVKVNISPQRRLHGTFEYGANSRKMPRHYSDSQSPTSHCGGAASPCGICGGKVVL